MDDPVARLNGPEWRFSALEGALAALRDWIRSFEREVNRLSDEVEAKGGDVAVLEQTLDALKGTVGLLESTSSNQEKSLSLLKESQTTISEFIFGRNDPVTLKHISGLRDIVSRNDLLLKVALVLLLIPAIHALGVPTNWLGEGILHYFGITVPKTGG